MMLSGSVSVPVSLLLDPHLLLSAKLVWAALRLLSPQEPVRPALLQSCTGLSRPTVRKAVAGLAAAGWASTSVSGSSTTATPRQPRVLRLPRTLGQPSAVANWATDQAPEANPAPAAGRVRVSARVALPGALVADQRVGVQATILYGLLQVTPGFGKQSGQFSYAQLCELLGVSRNTVKRAVRELVQAGWLQISQRHQLAPVCFTLDNPERARGVAAVAGAQKRLHRADFQGEALMREYLSLLVDSDRFEDDAAPGFLVNPFTGERLQLDRYYTHLGVAFEYNGPQHYGPTERFSQEEATRQRGRDYVKMGICVTEGITLQVIHAQDLTLKTLQAKVADHLPLRDLRGHEPLIAYLESASHRYRRAAERGRQAAGV